MRIFLIGLMCFLGACAFNEGESELCFVGDSITHQWDLNYFFPGYSIKKHAVAGARVEDIDNWDVSDCKGLTTVILIGTNDIGMIRLSDSSAESSRSYFAKLFMERARRINAENLVAVSILPRNYLGKQDTSVNQNIELQNAVLKDSLRSSSLRFTFVNVFPDFLGDGYEIDESLLYDGLHPSPEGYEVLTRRVREKL
jgi:lysophospholipase L1-like esterase